MKDLIFEAFDNNQTLVFTSEVVANNWMINYLQNKKEPIQAIRKNRAISWDQFKFGLVKTSNKRPVTNIARRIFANNLLDDNTVFKQLRFFVNKECEESKKSYASAIAGYLQYFVYFDLLNSNDKNLEPDIKNDIDIIKPLYEAFLEENNYYEFSYLYANKDTRQTIDYEKYCLVLPDTFNDPDIINDIKDKCQVIKSESKEKENLIAYQNSLSEVRDTFRQIHSILSKKDNNGKQQVHSYDVAITCPCIDSYKPFMEEEAKKYDIKLHFTNQTSLINSVPGKFFLALDKIKKEKFSFYSINNLLMNPIFPFKKDYIDINHRIIDYAIDTKLINGPVSEWIRHIDATSKRTEFYDKTKAKFPNAKDDKEKFKNLMDGISTIFDQKHPKEIREAILAFVDKNFEWKENQFLWNKCLNILNNLKEFEQVIDVWTVFIDLLGETSYTEETKEDGVGIPVYSYPVSAGLYIPYHFVIGLCDDKTTITYDKYPFWQSKKDQYLPIQSTAEVLNVISNIEFCEHLHLSGTTKMFDGSHLLPVSMLNSVKETFGDKADEAIKKQVQERFENDYYKIEKNSFIKNKNIQQTTNNQKNAYIKAKDHILAKETVKFPASDKLQGKDEKHPKNVSASYFKGYSKCPYWGYIDIYNRPNQKDFEPKQWDVLVIGNILHEAIQDSLEVKTNFWALDKTTLVANLEKAIKYHADKFELCSEAEQKAIFGKYSKLLPSINETKGKDKDKDETKTAKFIPTDAYLYENEVDYKNSDNHKLGLDNYLKLEGLNIAVGGRPDTILKYEETGITKYILLDYKTTGTADYDNNLEKCSPQLAIYARLIEANEKKEGHADAKVTHGAYYSINNEEMKIVWPRIQYTAGNRPGVQGHFLSAKDDIFPDENKYKDTQYVDETIQNLFNRFTESVNNSSFEKTEDESKCEDCFYKRICRKEFIAK